MLPLVEVLHRVGLLRFFSVRIIPPIVDARFDYTLLLPDEQTDEAWEPSKTQCCLAKRGVLNRKALSSVFKAPFTICCEEGHGLNSYTLKAPNFVTISSVLEREYLNARHFSRRRKHTATVQGAGKVPCFIYHSPAGTLQQWAEAKRYIPIQNDEQNYSHVKNLIL